MLSYEKLDVYQKAFAANQLIYRHLKANSQILPYIKNQLGRACLSVMLNIAEGSAKFTPRDKKNFFVIARGSVFECYSIISFLAEEGEIPHDLKVKLNFLLEDISKMLFSLVRNLSVKPN